MRFFFSCLVLSCLIHATGWANAPRWGEGRPHPHHPNICPEGPWQAPVSGLASPEFGFPLSPTTSHTSAPLTSVYSQAWTTAKQAWPQNRSPLL